jgi:hypothetical protein
MQRSAPEIISNRRAHGAFRIEERKTTMTTTNGERINLLDILLNPGFDPRKKVEQIMDEHPKATQEEIYKLAFLDRKFVSAAVTEAVTNAMLAIKDAELKAAPGRRRLRKGMTLEQALTMPTK